MDLMNQIFDMGWKIWRRECFSCIAVDRVGTMVLHNHKQNIHGMFSSLALGQYYLIRYRVEKGKRVRCVDLMRFTFIVVHSHLCKSQ